MPDPRFFERLGPFTLAKLAAWTGSKLANEAEADKVIDAVAPLDRAGGDALSFLADRRYLAELRRSSAGACFIAPDYAEAAPDGCAVLLTPEPLAAYAKAASRLHQPRRHPAQAPAVHPEAELADGVVLGHHVVIGPGVRIGANTEIGPGAVITPGVTVGRECRIGANVTIGFALIGDRVRILAGAVIGEAGFGVADSRAGAIDVPQLGRVIIQDGVTLGANSCVDRGAFDDTTLGENTKIDNLVQIAHNVQLGRNCVLAAHTGISGSVTVGDAAMFGGRAGIADHLVIGARAKIAAAAGVMKDVPDGEIWCGTPARPLKRFMRETAWLARNAASKSGGGGDR